jgi:hypothetical protein
MKDFPRVKRVRKGESHAMPSKQDGCVIIDSTKNGYLISIAPDECSRQVLFVSDAELKKARGRKCKQ